MCHEWKMRRYRERDDRLDEELQYLLDEHERQTPPTPILEEERDDEPAEPMAPRAEVGARS